MPVLNIPFVKQVLQAYMAELGYQGETIKCTQTCLKNFYRFLKEQTGIKDLRDTEIKDIEYEVSVVGGLLEQIDENVEGVISTLPAGEEEIIEVPVFGLGSIEINTIIDTLTEEAKGFVFLFFVLYMG